MKPMIFVLVGVLFAIVTEKEEMVSPVVVEVERFKLLVAFRVVRAL